MHHLAFLAALAPVAIAKALLPRQSSSHTATVAFSVNNGDVQQLAAGVLYGIPGGL